MKKFTKNALQFILSIGLALLFLYLAFRGKNLGQLWDSLLGVSWGWFVLLFAGTVASHIIRAWRWKYLLAPVKKDISLRNAFSVVMIGYLINNVIPRLGELIRPYALGKLEGVSKSATMGTIVLERILDLVSFALVVLTGLSLYSRPFLTWFPQLAGMEWLFFVGAVLMFLIFLMMFLKAEWFFNLFKGIVNHLPQQWKGEGGRIFDSFISGFRAAKETGNFFMIGLTSILIWLSYIVMLYIPFYIYDFPSKYGLDFGSATLLQIVSGLAFAFPTPSGIGSYHSFMSFTLTRLFNIGPVEALSYAVYTHATGFIATTVVGLYYFFADKMHVADMMKNNEKTSEPD